MKNNFALSIIEILIFGLVIGTFCATLDYLRISNAETPMFCLKEYNETTKIENFTSLLYTAERKVREDNTEPLYKSKNIKYKLFGIINIKVPEKYLESNFDKKINITETENCANESKLYFADQNIKVYTYCIDEIEIGSVNEEETLKKKLNEDSTKTVNELKNRLLISKFSPGDIITYELKNKEVSADGITLYQCDRINVNDIYIGTTKTIQQPDFCTYKDDDFKFISKIEEEEHNLLAEETNQPEVFYEDDHYLYEFSEPKANYIYLVTPAVRGKEAQKIPLNTVLNNKLLTIDELAEKGLKFNKKEKQETKTNE
ncbi:MAG: hypothetical protein IJI22_02690 [Bacilli bacterium]|nr:hypothetical protein [Bacilli bacterium]